MEATAIKEGMSVHYAPSHGSKENGIVKRVNDDKTAAWVVYNCGNDWSNYRNYTGALTNLRDLREGWANDLPQQQAHPVPVED